MVLKLKDRLWMEIGLEPLPTLKKERRRTEDSIFHMHDRVLGETEDSDAYLADWQREGHCHILGSVGQGKSKFIELLVRQDIERGYGACVIDPSENGDTAYRILRYCYSIGFDKVVFINPFDFKDRVPVFNPIKYEEDAAVSTGNIIDTIQVLWNGRELINTPNIERYASAVLHALHASRMTLAESEYFFSTNPLRDLMRDTVSGLDRQLLSDKPQALDTTLARFRKFSDPHIRAVVGSKRDGIPFEQLIRDGWLVLVNLHPQLVWGAEQSYQRLLGTLIINEVSYAIDRLNQRNWKGRYYLYIDEVGDYATTKIAYILDKKRKTGLSLTVAHQHFDQIENAKVLSAIRASTQIKVLFYTPNISDRMTMLKDMGFGGADETDRSIAHRLGELDVAEAAIKVYRRPEIVRLLEVHDTPVSGDRLTTFKKHLYSQPWFYPFEAINQEISARLHIKQPHEHSDRTSGEDPVPAGPAKADDGAPNRRNRQRTQTRRKVRTFFSEGE